MNMNSQSKAWPYVIGMITGLPLLAFSINLNVLVTGTQYAATELHTSLSNVLYIPTLTSLFLSMWLIYFGRLSDRFGHKRMFRYAILAYTIVTTVTIFFSNNITWLWVYAVISGTLYAFLQSANFGIISHTVNTEDTNKVIGINFSMLGTGAVISLTLNKLLIFTWHFGLLFVILAVLGFIAYMGTYVLKESKKPAKPLPLKASSLLIVSLFMFFITLSFEGFLRDVHIGWVLFGTSIVCAIAIFVIERKASIKLVKFSKLRSIHFHIPLIITFGTGVAMLYALMLVQEYLGTLYSSQLLIGSINSLNPLSFTISSFFFTKFIKKALGDKALFITTLIMCIGLGGMSIAILSSLSIFILSFFIIVFGFGAGFSFPIAIGHIIDSGSTLEKATYASFGRSLQMLGFSFGPILFLIAKELPMGNLQFFQKASIFGLGVILFLFIIMLFSLTYRQIIDEE